MSGGSYWWKSENISYLHDVVIEEQPEAVALHDGDVVSAVGTTAERKEK